MADWGLEYRILQLYNSEPGPRQARLDFSIDGIGADSSVIKRWDFDTGMEGWFVQRHMAVRAVDGVVIGRSTGNDPSIAALVRASGGRFKVRFSVRTSDGSYGQVFWWTKEKPGAEGQRRLNVLLSQNGGQWKEYEVEFNVLGGLRGIRIDLGMKSVDLELDWVQLACVGANSANCAAVDVNVTAVESRKVTLWVQDENGEPCTAAFVIEDDNGRVFPAQAKRLAPEFFFHPQVYRADGERIRLPDGKYTIRRSRGPESIPETRKLTVDGSDTVLRCEVKRWVAPSKRGWLSPLHESHGRRLDRRHGLTHPGRGLEDWSQPHLGAWFWLAEAILHRATRQGVALSLSAALRC